MSVTFLSPAIDSYPMLARSLLEQTDGDWTCYICFDGPPTERWRRWMSEMADDRIHWMSSSQKMGHWGHPIRRQMITSLDIQTDYVVQASHDCYICPTMVREINGRTNDVVWWDCLHNYWAYTAFFSRLEFSKIDLSCVAVKAGIAKKIGWPSLDHAADWLWIQEIIQQTDDWYKISNCLYVHN